MAYLLYKTMDRGDDEDFQLLRQSGLGGSNSGIIARFLRGAVTPSTEEPWKWHVPMAEALRALEGDANAFVIDLKPSDQHFVSLYEVRNIWGFSADGWTPIMLELETLLVDQDARAFNKSLFRLARIGREQVFTFLYLSGSVTNGYLTGTWNFPRPSATNSVLLWPQTLAYFMEQAGYRAVAMHQAKATVASLDIRVPARTTDLSSG